MPVSEAQKRAKAKYDKKAYDNVLIRLRKGRHEVIKQAAAMTGESFNAFVADAIEQKLRSVFPVEGAEEVAQESLES